MILSKRIHCLILSSNWLQLLGNNILQYDWPYIWQVIIDTIKNTLSLIQSNFIQNNICSKWKNKCLQAIVHHCNKVGVRLIVKQKSSINFFLIFQYTSTFVICHFVQWYMYLHQLSLNFEIICCIRMYLL